MTDKIFRLEAFSQLKRPISHVKESSSLETGGKVNREKMSRFETDFIHLLVRGILDHQLSQQKHSQWRSKNVCGGECELNGAK